jgi:Beta-propeller repeat
MQMKNRWRLVLPLVALSVSCSDDALTPGTEGGPCYGNETCNPGLTCASNLCVALPDHDSGPWADGAVDASPPPDGPGADADGPGDQDLSQKPDLGGGLDGPSPTGGWAIPIQSGTDARIEDIAVDKQGSILIVGYYEGTATFGTKKVPGYGSDDIFVAKVSPAGKVVWVKTFGTSNEERVEAVAVDASGNVLIAGRFTNNLSFDTIPITTSNGQDLFVAKLSPAGKVTWARNAGASGGDYAWDLAVDSAGNAYVVGSTNVSSSSGTATFGTLTYNTTSKDGFVAKLDPAGTFKWVHQLGGNSEDSAWAVAAETAGNVFVTGTFMSTAQIGTSFLSSAGGIDAYVAKVSGAGAFSWVTHIAGMGTDQAYGAAVGPKGPVISGFMKNSTKFGTLTVTPKGTCDAYVALMDTSGKFTGVSTGKSSSTSSCAAMAVSVDGAGKIYAGGFFNKTLTLGTHTVTISGGSPNPWVARLDASTAWDWATAAGGAQSYAYAVANSPSGHVYLAGYFKNTVSFGKTKLTAQAMNAGYLWKIAPP